MLGKAISLAAKLFENKTDKGGNPYILHCMRVMNAVSQYRDNELMQIAILHDVVEDTDTTFKDLGDMGFSVRVLKALRLLTHKKEIDYDQYISVLSINADAVKVKLADLKDNSDATRLKGLRKKDFERMEKYHKAYVYLSE